MRIVVDFRVLSTEAADRGMGRFTQQQLVRALARGGEHEFIVLTYPGCRFDVLDPGLHHPGVRMVELELRTLRNGILSVDDADLLEFSAELQDAVYELGPDVYHSTTPFVAPVVEDFDVCPVVSTLYDLIPLIFPSEYLTERSRPEYLRGLTAVSRSSRIIAISESARDDAVRHLGVDRARIAVVYPWVEPEFHEMTPQDREAIGALVRSSYAIPPRFVLSVTGVHHSKNARVLLEGWALARAWLPLDVELVVVVPTEPARRAWERSYGHQVGVRVLQGISDRELSWLYNSAEVVVHPSRYEGFGYPVAEAMACAAPTLAARTPAVSEIVGPTGAHFDPDRPEELAAALAELVSSPERRLELRRAGAERSHLFDHGHPDSATVEAYGMAAQEAGAGGTGPRVALWSSMPPLPCGVADYSSELAGALAESADLEVFVDGGYLPSPDATRRTIVHHYASFGRRNEQRPFDAVFYQVGGTGMQEFMYRPLQQQPGHVVLHDLLMARGFFHLYGAHDRLDEFRETIVRPEGQVALRAFDEARSRSSALDGELGDVFDEHPMLGWLVAASASQIVHMPDSADELRSRYTGARPVVVDMGVEDPWRGRTTGDITRLRLRHRLATTGFVVGVFGTVVPIKRVDVCLRAVRALCEDGVEASLVVVGDTPNRQYRDALLRLIAELQLDEHVRLVGRAGRAVFDDLLLAVDAVVNLRYPSMKGMSATLIRALAAGKPVVISDIPEWREFPTDACFAVPPGEQEVARVTAVLGRLAHDDGARSAAARSARRFFAERGRTTTMAARYLEVAAGSAEPGGRP